MNTEVKLCKCGCQQELIGLWGQAHDYIKGHKTPETRGHKISKVQSNSKVIQLESSTMSVPLMIAFAKEKINESKLQVSKWETVLRALEDKPVK